MGILFNRHSLVIINLKKNGIAYSPSRQRSKVPKELLSAPNWPNVVPLALEVRLYLATVQVNLPCVRPVPQERTARPILVRLNVGKRLSVRPLCRSSSIGQSWIKVPKMNQALKLKPVRLPPIASVGIITKLAISIIMAS